MKPTLSAIEGMLNEFEAIKGIEKERRKKLLKEIKNSLDEYKGGVTSIFERYELDGRDKSWFLDLFGRWARHDGILELNPEYYTKGASSGGAESYLKSKVAAAKKYVTGTPNTAMKFFPYGSFYGGQGGGIEAVRSSAEAGGVLLLDSPTGTGKTAMALAGLLNAAEEGEKVVVLTRTHSQYDNFIREAAAINAAGYGLKCGFLLGKERICPVGVSRFRCSSAQKRALKSIERGEAVMSKRAYVMDKAGKLKQGVLGFGCPYYGNTYERDQYGKLKLRPDAQRLVKEQHESPKTVEEFLKACEEFEYPICPYEAMKNTLPDAKVLILHYLYFIDSRICGRLYEGGWVGCAPEETHVLIDEAHNIRENIIDQNSESFQYDALTESVGFLEDAAQRRGDYDLSKLANDVDQANILLAAVSEEARKWFTAAIKANGIQEETMLLDMEKVGSTAWLMWEGTPAFSIDEAGIKSLKKVAGEIARQFETMAAAERLPDVFDTPLVCAVADVLDDYYRLTEDRYMKYISFERPEQSALGAGPIEDYRLRFNVSDIDPRDIMGSLARQSKSVTLMSGTLHPPELFQKLLFYAAVPVSRHQMSNPFPRENRTLLVVTDATSSYQQRNEPANVKSIESVIEALAESKGNVGLFFPSYEMLKSYSETCARSCAEHGKTLLSEHAAPDKRVLIRQFKAARNAMVVGVCRGSLSEGIDYPGEQMEAVAVIGVPLARYSKHQMRIRDYYTKRSMDGETLTYNLPAIIAASQALGRCIRSEKDKGTLILVDTRYMYDKYRRLLPEWMRQEAKAIKSNQVREHLGEKLNQQTKRQIKGKKQ